MEPLICQSCGLPFSGKGVGTNRDHSKNPDYCITCFKDGEYTDQHLSMRDMEKKLFDMARHHDEISIEEAQQVIATLPDLKRWKITHIL